MGLQGEMTPEEQQRSYLLFLELSRAAQDMITDERHYTLDEVIGALLTFAGNQVACGLDDLPLDQQEEAIHICVQAFEANIRRAMTMLKTPEL